MLSILDANINILFSLESAVCRVGYLLLFPRLCAVLFLIMFAYQLSQASALIKNRKLLRTFTRNVMDEGEEMILRHSNVTILRCAHRTNIWKEEVGCPVSSREPWHGSPSDKACFEKSKLESSRSTEERFFWVIHADIWKTVMVTIWFMRQRPIWSRWERYWIVSKQKKTCSQRRITNICPWPCLLHLSALNPLLSRFFFNAV